jgi:hypothetical protein
MLILGLMLRTMFLVIVLVITARVASPQTEKFWSAYDTPDDLLRIVLGVAVCVFLTVQIFRYSRDPADMRKWVVVGGAAVPLALLCGAIVW